MIRALAESEPQTALLGDPHTIFMAAFDGDTPVGFAFGYVLPRRHGDAEILFVYEVEVDETHRGRGIATDLLGAHAAEAGVASGFVLTEPDNDAANALYRSLGGDRVDTVM